jgi:hypothetical protein
MSDINMPDINMPVTDTDGAPPHEMTLAEVDEASVVDVGLNETPQEDEPDDIPELPEVRRAKVDIQDRYLALHLPPMYTLEEIFNDLAAKALSLGFGDVVKRVGDRPLRIATVCSGTESPILAMEMFLKGELVVYCSLLYTYPGFNAGPRASRGAWRVRPNSGTSTCLPNSAGHMVLRFSPLSSPCTRHFWTSLTKISTQD